MARTRQRNQLEKLKISGYDFERLQYPAVGLGSDRIPNYIIFYINLPNPAGYEVAKGQPTTDRLDALTRGKNEVFYGNSLAIGGGATTIQTFGNIVGQAGRSGSVNIPLSAEEFGEAAAGKAVSAGVGTGIAALAQNIKKKPKTNRIKSAIALYMPDTVFQTYSHDYDALSVTAATGMLGMAQRGASSVGSSFSTSTAEGAVVTSDSISNAIKGIGGSPGGREVGGFIAEQSGLVGPGFTDLLLRDLGKALNPQIEMVYKKTQNRSFVFDFRMQPRSRSESISIKNIVKQFKKFSAPSIAGDSDGAYFNIPGQFDIEFMFKSNENKFIGKISTCVLENIDVNYSSAGPFATFDDGAPVEVNLQLRFTEVDTLTREVFEEYDKDNNATEASF